MNEERFVIEYGFDCDGVGKEIIYLFETEHEADQFAENAGESSDGLRYLITNKTGAMQFLEASYPLISNSEELLKEKVRVV